jgi:DNA-binding MarR family transcriptional regulator
MKSAPPTNAARELKLLTASFAKVRILHYVSEAPITAATIAERLGRHGDPASSSQILASLVRRGLIRAEEDPTDSTPQYSLTRNGHRLLATAKKHLRRVSAGITTRA